MAFFHASDIDELWEIGYSLLYFDIGLHYTIFWFSFR